MSVLKLMKTTKILIAIYFEGLDMVQYPPDSRTNGALPLGDYMIIIAKVKKFKKV